MIKLTNGKRSVEVFSDVQKSAFLNSGWKEMTEPEEKGAQQNGKGKAARPNKITDTD